MKKSNFRSCLISVDFVHSGFRWGTHLAKIPLKASRRCEPGLKPEATKQFIAGRTA